MVFVSDPHSETSFEDVPRLVVIVVDVQGRHPLRITGRTALDGPLDEDKLRTVRRQSFAV
jgi:hypothetical protein